MDVVRTHTPPEALGLFFQWLASPGSTGFSPERARHSAGLATACAVGKIIPPVPPAELNRDSTLEACCSSSTPSEPMSYAGFSTSFYKSARNANAILKIGHMRLAGVVFPRFWRLYRIGSRLK